MVELVDTTDLKSVDPKGRAGSSPAPGTFKKKPCIIMIQGFLGSAFSKMAGHSFIADANGEIAAMCPPHLDSML